MRSAVALHDRLWKTLSAIDDGSLPVAELHRRVGVVADSLGLTRPSYQTVRRAARAQRQWTSARPSTAEVLLEITTRARPPEHLLDLLGGTLQEERDLEPISVGRDL